MITHKFIEIYDSFGTGYASGVDIFGVASLGVIALLNANPSYSGCTNINQSINGTKSTDWAVGTSNWTTAKAAAIAGNVTDVFYGIGINDTQTGSPTSVSAYTSNVQGNINDAIANITSMQRFWLCGPGYPLPGYGAAWTSAGPASAIAYRAAQAAIAAANPGVVRLLGVNILETLQANVLYRNNANDLHPSVNGAYWIARNIADGIMAADSYQASTQVSFAGTTDFSATMKASLTANVAPIKTKTDNLPTAPAGVSDVAAVGTAVAANTTGITANSTAITAVGVTAAAIKAKTDNLPTAPAAVSDVSAVGTAVAANTTGITANSTAITAVGVTAAAIKAKTDNLPATFPANFGALSISLGGKVAATLASTDVTGTLATNTTQWGGASVTGMPLPTSSYVAPPSVVAIRAEMDANSTKLTNLDATVSSRSTFATGGSVVLSGAGLDAIVVETGVNARQALSPILAAVAGTLAGAGTGTITVKGGNVATTRIVATTDASGNRSAIALTLPA